jgi:hypothetical protein
LSATYQTRDEVFCFLPLPLNVKAAPNGPLATKDFLWRLGTLFAHPSALARGDNPRSNSIFERGSHGDL